MFSSYFHLLKTSWNYLKGLQGKFVLTYVLFIFANLTLLLKPLFIAFTINVFEQGKPNPLPEAILWLSLFILTELVFWAFHYPARIIERTLAFELGKRYRQKLFHTLLNLPLHWHKNHHSGAILDRANKSSESLEDFFGNGFIFVRVIISYIASLGIIIYFSGWYALIAIGLTIGIFRLITFFDRKLYKDLRTVNEKTHEMNATFQDYIGNLITVIALKIKTFARHRLARKIQGIQKPYQTMIRTNETKWFYTSLGLSLVGAVTLISYIVGNYDSTAFSIAALTALISYVYELNEATYSFTANYETVIKNHANLRSGEAIIQSAEGKSNPHLPIGEKWRKIEVKNLNFIYKDEEKKAHHLKNINLTFKPGERIAFVGESGSGKSTMLKILAGLEWTKKAQIVIDGQTFGHSLAVAHFSTLLPQNPETFNNTIGYNITLGQKISAREVQKFIKAAKFDRALRDLPNGLKTHIKEKGVNLSGGQAQRLALTRGLIAARHSTLILLDEPTSSIDPKNELAIYQNIFKMFPKACIISSVHKPYLLEMFDKVYQFEKGEIINGR